MARAGVAGGAGGPIEGVREFVQRRGEFGFGQVGALGALIGVEIEAVARFKWSDAGIRHCMQRNLDRGADGVGGLV